MGITDAPRSSRDSDERPKESAKRARLSRPRGTKSEALVLVEGLDSDSHRRGFSRVGDDAEKDGSYFIGDIGAVPEKTWERLNPYAVATPK